MKYHCLSTILNAAILSVLFAVTRTDGDTLRIRREDRRIQRDGFLLEWDRADAQFSNDSQQWWDARITPGGLSGYCAVSAPDSCFPWIVCLTRDTSDSTLSVTMQLDTMPSESSFYTIAPDVEAALHGRTTVVAEWILDWENFSGNETTPDDTEIAVVVQGNNECGDTLSFVGSFSTEGNSGISFRQLFTPRIIVQALLILFLLVGYLFLSFRARRMKSRRHSEFNG